MNRVAKRADAHQEIRYRLSKLMKRALNNRVFDARQKKTPVALVRLVGYIMLVDGQEERDRTQEALVGLFMGHQRRRARWRPALDAFPADVEIVNRVTACCEEYNRLAHHLERRSLEEARLKVDEVLKVMIQLGDPAAYIRQGAANDFFEPDKIFSRGALKWAKENNRGALSRYGKMREGHKEEIRKNLKVF